MDHELVIKFWRQPLPDEVLMSAIESELANALGDSAKLDGHDSKGGEINLFIVVDDPKRAFFRVRRVLERMGIVEGFAAASRLIGGAKFTSMWPPRATRKFKLT